MSVDLSTKFIYAQAHLRNAAELRAESSVLAVQTENASAVALPGQGLSDREKMARHATMLRQQASIELNSALRAVADIASFLQAEQESEKAGPKLSITPG